MTNDELTTHELPEGFQEIELDWGEIPTVDWAVTTVLQGTVTGGRWIPVQRKGGLEITGALKISTGEGDFILWETYQLIDFMRGLRRGDEIYIAYRGKRKLKGGKSLNVFQSAYRAGPEHDTTLPFLHRRPVPTTSPVTDGRDALPAGAAPHQGDLPFDDTIPF